MTWDPMDITPEMQFALRELPKYGPAGAAIADAVDRIIVHEQGRIEAVIVALKDHVGGLDVAVRRLRRETQATDEGHRHAIFLDDALVWSGRWRWAGLKCEWTETFTPVCPAEVADAVPAVLHW